MPYKNDCSALGCLFFFFFFFLVLFFFFFFFCFFVFFFFFVFCFLIDHRAVLAAKVLKQLTKKRITFPQSCEFQNKIWLRSACIFREYALQ